MTRPLTVTELRGFPVFGSAPGIAPYVARSHSHGSTFMHSDVLTFYTYTVVPELYFVVVTVSLVSLFIPSGGGSRSLAVVDGWIRAPLRSSAASLYSIYNCEIHPTFFGFGRPTVCGSHCERFSFEEVGLVEPM
jgi:hypothetical protein